jgi:predicted GH43/DUF377 family glycosyl hydrolase
MSWKKKGLIFVPDSGFAWARSGAQLPTAEVLDDRIRVYFAAKDSSGYGRIGSVELDRSDPSRVLHVNPMPVLDLGELGAFDDCGVVPNYIVEYDGRTLLYYQGFQRTERVPYLTFTGLAVADSGGTRFVKHSRIPITDRTGEEPFIRSTPCVLRQDEGWRMWYVSTTKWIEDEHGLHYICVIRHANSPDGIHWNTTEGVCLEPELPDEYAVGRPSVVFDGEVYRMWYSIRSFKQLYSIGFAESRDGLVWTRKDELAGIEKSADGWDSEMICYPNIVNADGRFMMFYNGNGRGLTGFGFAVLES